MTTHKIEWYRAIYGRVLHLWKTEEETLCGKNRGKEYQFLGYKMKRCKKCEDKSENTLSSPNNVILEEGTV